MRDQPSVNSPAPPELSKREVRSKRYSPCKSLCTAYKECSAFANLSFADANRKKNPAALPGGRSKFDDPESPYLPPAIPAWKKALENVNVDEAQFSYKELIPTDLGYVFPEPATFMSIQSPERQKAFFQTWLKYRTTLIYRVSSGSSNARPMPNTVWRTLLSFEFVLKDGVRKSGTRSHKIREVVTDFLQNCLEEEGVGLADVNHNTEITWNGKAFEALGKDEFEEILWELAELNFRFELSALDSRASTSNVDRPKLVSACFPRPPTGASLVVVDLGAANRGLASPTLEERQEFLQALRKVMSSWRGELPPIIGVKKYRWSNEELEELEKVLAIQYCKTFYNYFRRAPHHTPSPFPYCYSLPDIDIPCHCSGPYAEHFL